MPSLGSVSGAWVRDYRRTQQKDTEISLHRVNPKRDANELAIVEGLRKIGAQVERLDICDLLILYDERLYLLEVKTPSSRRRLTDRQRRLLSEGWPMKIVTTVSEALQAVTGRAL
jgi:hypothetical protein